jgi:putative CocE/NonD family hydrolase
MDVMIPMRDGIRLRTKLFIPANISSNLPFLFSRTPYGIPDHDPLMYVALSMYPVPSYQGVFCFAVSPLCSLRNKWHSALLSDSFMRSGTFTNSTLYWEIIKEGFILVFQDIRGRYGSEGVFSLARAPRDKSYSNTIDEATDAYDTIDWLLNNVDSHNGKVGMWGVGYDAMMTVRAMLDPHPALVAASPQGTPADLFKNDDFAHNGAFRLSPAFGYVAEMERDGGRIKQTFNFTRLDNYEFFLHDLQYLKNADINYFNESIPTWNSFRNHPVYDTYWLNKSLVPYMTKAPPCPTLNVAGWFDAEDFNGSMTIYQGFEKYDTNNNNFLSTTLSMAHAKSFRSD